ncbi:hypothetical protein QAD02_008839 [Eretmocerus hayati]|uniref:Uncharacterized protein n=1 Tax=Eretmocerus hayati TaxID=131215 RepID=A0ACC2N803_9HYME|nr:hypothetical protein QAD02_008839 [Eretmocerus hayati]
MDEEKRMIISELQTSNLIKILANTKSRRCAKSSESSEENRKKGNELYVRNDHTAQTHGEILKLYSKSVALAPTQSEELALAYGNRSALLLHIEKFEECIQDIDKALKITKSHSLRQKLSHRKMECLDHLKCLERVRPPQHKQIRAMSCEENNNLSDAAGSKLDEKGFKIDNNCHLSTKINSGVCKSLAVSGKTKTQQRDGASKKISIKYNEKYGRHLVAAQDMKPGEVILIAKPYVSSLIIKNPYLKCCHCLSIAWSGIPCNHCGWFLFCSNKCKAEAWEKYHAIECPCIPHLTHFLNHFENAHQCQAPFDGLSLRALIQGVKEAGSLSNLKKEIEIVDKCSDMRTRGFSKDGQFDCSDFKSLYSLSYHVPLHEIKSLVVFATAAVVCLAKYTSFFGENFQFSKPEDLVRNTDVVFAGALLLRLAKISRINSHCINNVTNQCQYSRTEEDCLKNFCCVEGLCIVPIGSLTNHSCNPNARRCFTPDFEYILYATQPIKKNSQIFDSYFCTFFESPNPDRRDNVLVNFEFTCDCIACKDDWPHWPLVEMPFKILIASDANLLNFQEKEFYMKNEKMIDSAEAETCDYNLKFLHDVSKAIDHSFKKLPQPSVVTHKLILVLMQVFEKIYGYNSHIFYDCRL